MAGGAERSAKNLFHAFKHLGHESWLAVGRKIRSDPGILSLPNDDYRNGWVRCWNRFIEKNDPRIARIRGLGRLLRGVRSLGEPARWIQSKLGIEDFDFPATRHLLHLFPHRPDIIHCHNLHGGYFDLRELPSISATVPTVLNVRDGWLMSGHCAFSLDCQRWVTGCGKCPDLSLYPAANRDATALNWKRKKAIFEKSRVYVTTPSRWMLDMVNRSILSSAIIESRVIPNGVDTDTFHAGSQSRARRRLGLPAGIPVMMTAGFGLKSNVWKDYKTLHDALVFLNQAWAGHHLLMLIIGESGKVDKIGNIEIRNIPYQTDRIAMANYYRASDLYLHAARVESFGNVLIEARACGTPVISTAVGGIPEQIKSLNWGGIPAGITGHGVDEATGILTSPGDGQAIGSAVLQLLLHPEHCQALSANGQKDIERHFSVSIQAGRFLDWYREILSTGTTDGRGHQVARRLKN